MERVVETTRGGGLRNAGELEYKCKNSDVSDRRSNNRFEDGSGNGEGRKIKKESEKERDTPFNDQ